MAAKSFKISINVKSVLPALICILVCLGSILLIISIFMKKNSENTPAAKVLNSDYVILATNDLGMHCYMADYSSFMILPPGNNLRVQVFRKEGDSAKLVNSGIKVTYEFPKNTTSSDKINFWEYAKDYGYDIAPDIGITGNGLSGKFTLSEDGKFYIASAIPLTYLNDGSTEPNPYQLANIKVFDAKSGKQLAVLDNVVAPVSSEMDCRVCHVSDDPSLNILEAHDRLSGTSLVKDLQAGKRHKCNECHADNVLNAPGKPDIPSLSQAMHSFHQDKMGLSTITPLCYNCHPGQVTDCYRGVMVTAGVSCIESECHGDMENVAATLASGRKAWLQEPDCGNCHDTPYASNPGQLYRESYLINNISPRMNGFILCESCHNSTHAEWTSTNPIDNLVPKSIQGYAGYINKCSICHEAVGYIHKKSNQVTAPP